MSNENAAVVEATPEQVAASKKMYESIIARLKEPFPEEFISWKPQAVSKGEKTTALPAAYADARVYSDRLNEIFGPEGWTVNYRTAAVDPIFSDTKGQYGYDAKFRGKVFIIAEVCINSLGSHQGTGESWLTDENAITIAEAQAFKRACVRFGLGRYLYDLPKGKWTPYDKTTKQFTETPQLPDWAKPAKRCVDCTEVIKPFVHGAKTMEVSELVANGKNKYGRQLCAPCQKKAADALRTASTTELARPV